ncbi:MAG TPA: Holliday junction branch migration protein RuvA [bacterium]|nr:Holliday junction branch migration protein RuvA [bacterium]
MLAFIRGNIIAKRPGSVIVETNNLGYQVFIGEKNWESLQPEQLAEFFIYHNIREDADDLYGFNNLDELTLFELLISVSGVGPKSALSVLSLASAEQVKQAIIIGDESLLTKVSGIGKKTAQRLILELKNKISGLPLDLASSTALNNSVDQDDLEALLALGYNLQKARQALAKIDQQITDPAQRLKLALQQLR